MNFDRVRSSVYLFSPESFFSINYNINYPIND